MTNNKEPYAFKIYEKINFRQGEEVDDLYSISIDPEVDVIQESNYIQLRGVLIVSGDYQTMPKKEPLYIVDDEEENVVQQVRTLDNGFMTFQYPIPVDITVPTDRVQTDHRVEVKVDFFDYELPEPHTLNIQSSIRIDGISEREAEDTYPEQSAPSDFELKEFPTFQDQQEDSNQSDEQEVNAEAEQTAEQETAQPAEEPFEEVANTTDSEEEQKGREFFKKDKSQTLAEFFNKKKSNEDELEEKHEEKTEAKKTDTDLYKKEHAESTEVDHEDTDFDDYEVSAADPETEETEVGQKKEASGLSYLSKFFRNDEPTSSQLTVRFVQKNETLESIAEFYNLPSSKLERVNNLDDSTALEEGDVIYVPKTAKKS
ncbi:LysM peptidoglycan-binding domain-containing protein [Allobacillus sp. GCM10007489]|uniref:LysM peptidoglycan-binding domain-containing protein n=1 Tax=unclassified Allobacillus TaxID=2628859 RepID=UPI00164330D9|nr:LysM peptidoglycan-binding domain-containing protein [Allobacillus sp. SKP2-8]